MKKTLLTMALAGFAFTANAQVIVDENFDSYFPGNVGTDITGLTPGNGMFTIATNGTAPTTSTNAANENFQIVENGDAHINVLQITGTNGDKGSRNLWFEVFSDLWPERTAGNDIVEIEFDLFTGAGGGTSVNRTGLYVYNLDRTKILTGFSFDTKTLILSGVGYYAPPAPGTVGNYLFYLGGGSNNITLPANTWVRLGASFNKTTGQVIWKGSNPTFNGQVMGAATATDPDRTSFVSVSGTTTVAPIVTNTAAAVSLLDNISVRASNADTLLAIDEVAVTEASFAVYPNPASNVIKVSNNQGIQISQIKITDLNGRIVKTQSFNGVADAEMNISDLSSGVYMMDIASKEGSIRKKIVKN